jgi:hypothetical protein
MRVRFPRRLAEWVVFFLFWSVFLGLGVWDSWRIRAPVDGGEKAARVALAVSVVGFAVTGSVWAIRALVRARRRSTGPAQDDGELGKK